MASSIKVPELKDFSDAVVDQLKMQYVVPNFVAFVLSCVTTFSPISSLVAISLSSYSRAVWARLIKSE